MAQVTEGKYNPRRLILDALLGLKEKIFGTENAFNIWGCTLCDTCDEVCPQKIELTEVFTVLKNMSIAEGKGPEYYTTQATASERYNYIVWRVSNLFQLFDPMLILDIQG
mgnify:CR=1 FL=1